MEIYKLEMSLSEHTKNINDATKKFSSTEQMQKDIAHMYLMILWLTSRQCPIENWKEIKERANNHYQNTYRPDH